MLRKFKWLQVSNHVMRRPPSSETPGIQPGCARVGRPRLEKCLGAGWGVCVVEADHLYFSRRGREEREAAMRASHPGARAAHMQMAERFDDLAAAIAERN